MSLPFYVPPEKLMQDRADYARKGVSRGKAILAVEYDAGLLLMGENTSGTLHKISEIYDRIAFAGVGKYNEFESLRIAGVRHADVKGYAYDRSDVTGKSLANAYSQTLGNVFTQEVKPYEVEIIVAEVGNHAADNRIFRVTYDGQLHDERRFCAIGGESESLAGQMEEQYREGFTLAAAAEAVAAATHAVEERSIGAEGWEAAVLERDLGRRAFRRLTTEELTDLLA